MTKGLSSQQRRILAFLKTKQIPNSEDRGYFSLQEIMKDFSIEYVFWLREVENNPWIRNQKEHIDYGKYDKIRISLYRALRSLEKQGLVVSFLSRQTRFWAVPNRLKDVHLGGKVFHEMQWVKQDNERREVRQISWKWAVFIRNLPEDLHLKYKLRIWSKEEGEEIKRLWELSNPTKTQQNPFILSFK